MPRIDNRQSVRFMEDFRVRLLLAQPESGNKALLGIQRIWLVVASTCSAQLGVHGSWICSHIKSHHWERHFFARRFNLFNLHDEANQDVRQRLPELSTTCVWPQAGKMSRFVAYPWRASTWGKWPELAFIHKFENFLFQVKMMLNASPELRINVHEFVKVSDCPSVHQANLP